MQLEPNEIIFCNGTPTPYYKVKWDFQIDFNDLIPVLRFFYDILRKQKRSSKLTLKNITGEEISLDAILTEKHSSVLLEFAYAKDSEDNSFSEEDIDDEDTMDERPRELVEELYYVTKWKSLIRRRKYKCGDPFIHSPLKYIKAKKKSIFALGSLIETIREISTRMSTIHDKSIEEEEIVIIDNINQLARQNSSGKNQEAPTSSQPPSAKSAKDSNSEVSEVVKTIKPKDLPVEEDKFEKELLMKKNPLNFSRLPGNLSKFIAMKQIKKVETTMLKINNKQNTFTLEELREHRTERDAWIAIDGVIYDVSEYMNYHPGGKAILKSVLGKDATAVFNRCHSWVRHDTILNDKVVGVLDKST